MAKSKKQRELDEELLRECRGYTQTETKPDGAYIKHCSMFVNMNKIKRLIKAGADVNAKDNNGRLPLIFAAWELNKKLIKLLISAGADVNAKGNNGESLLHKTLGIIRTVHILIKAGADVNAQDNDGDTPLHKIADYKKLGTVELLISAGADVNAENLNGETPLLLLYDFVEIRNLLKEHGAVIIKK